MRFQKKMVEPMVVSVDPIGMTSNFTSVDRGRKVT